MVIISLMIVCMLIWIVGQRINLILHLILHLILQYLLSQSLEHLIPVWLRVDAVWVVVYIRHIETSLCLPLLVEQQRPRVVDSLRKSSCTM